MTCPLSPGCDDLDGDSSVVVAMTRPAVVPPTTCTTKEYQAINFSLIFNHSQLVEQFSYANLRGKPLLHLHLFDSVARGLVRLVYTIRRSKLALAMTQIAG